MKTRKYYISLIDSIEGLTDEQESAVSDALIEIIDDAENGFKEVADKLSSIRNVGDLDNVSEAMDIATAYAKGLY